jgi:pimeloyl-ACP methyl ester carboxylesterase
MPLIRLNSIDVHYIESGVGDTLLFLHGFTVDSRMWQPQVPFFARRFRVICPDSRGHGKSSSPPTGYSRDQRVEDLKALLDQLGIERCHLVGLSMGGSTGIGFALKYPDYLLSLALVSTGAAGFDVGKKISYIDQLAQNRGVDAAKDKWMHWSLRWYGDNRAEIRDLMRKMMLEHSGAIWLDPMRGKYPRTVDLDHAHAINIPTHIFVGQLDQMFVPLAKSLHERISGSQLTLYEDVGHMVNLEIPDRFNHDLLQFLTSVD